MDLSKFMTSFLIFALFSVALIAFAVNIGTENNAENIITDNNSAISAIYTGVNQTIYSNKDKANDSFVAFNDEGGNTGVLSSISEFFISSILYVGKSIMGVGNSIFNVTFLPILKAIGLPTDVARIVGIIVSMILMFSVVLMGWKLYRTGI